MIYTVTLNPAVDKTARIDGFAAGGVNRIESMRADAGGKGVNVSRAIAALGGKSVALGIVGGGTGDMIENSLHDLGVATDFVRTATDTRTNLKIIDAERGLTTDINEKGAAVEKGVIAQVEQKLTALKPGDIAVIAGSAPAGAPYDIYARLVRLCNAHEAKTVLDADGALLREGIKSKPYLIKPNIDELACLTGKRPEGIKETARAAMALVKGGILNVVVSLGGSGALFCAKGGAYYSPALSVPVRSTVGAGDSMVAAICLTLDSGGGIFDMIALSQAAGAASVTQSGTLPVNPALVKELSTKVSWEKII